MAEESCPECVWVIREDGNGEIRSLSGWERCRMGEIMEEGVRGAAKDYADIVLAARSHDVITELAMDRLRRVIMGYWDHIGGK